MKQNNSFLKVLDKSEKKIQLMSEQIKNVRFLYKCGHISEAYDKAMQLEETSEKAVLLTRVLPAYTAAHRRVLKSTILSGCASLWKSDLRLKAGFRYGYRRFFRKRAAAPQIMSVHSYTLQCVIFLKTLRRFVIQTVY